LVYLYLFYNLESFSSAGNFVYMPYKERKVEKLYYSIGEVANMFDVNTSLIRFWEKEFDIIKPHKNKKGNRFFTKQDINNIQLIHHLVKEKGMTLNGAKKKLKENRDDTAKNFEVIKSLNEIKNLLLQIKDNL
jgi:DNA-binding transcriptional MerR regulator